MEPSRRGYLQTRVEVAGVQPGHVRFNRDDSEVPRVGIGRNNLTALSQYRNLFFVAYSEEVYVYEPRFPCQSLGKDPTLVIKLPVSKPGLPGHINPRYPHVINHMVVDDLGDEETLACCCDDGDVVLYHVTAIARVIDLRAEHGPFGASGNRPEDCVGLRAVRPFYHWNVGRSAWGLAMHKAGRMIAVSNNNHVIDVIAFALRQPAPGSSSASSASDDDDNKRSNGEGLPAPEPSTSAAVAPRPPPVGNRHVRLRGHLNNIPSVAFCNDDRYDAKGEWLVSTDINGIMIVWNIWSCEIIVRYQFGNEPVAPRGELNGDWELNCGWSVLCLARDTFRKCDNDQEVYGMKQLDSPKRTLDISRSIDDVEESPALWPLDDGDNADPAGLLFADEASTTASDDIFMNMLAQAEHDDADMTFYPSPGAGSGDGSGADDEMDIALDVAMDEAMEALMDSELLSLGIEEDSGNPLHNAFTGTQYGPDYEPMSGDDGDEYDDDDGDDDDDPEPHEGDAFYGPETNAVGNDPILNAAAPLHPTDRTMMSPTPYYSQAARLGMGPRRKRIPLRFCILHTSDICVRLLDTPSSGPSVICRGPLAQAMAHESPLARYKRLNMVLHVPELSLVVVGCQAGRVALFTMTVNAAEPSSSSSSSSSSSCGFRLEHILPYASQELAGHRPNLPLLGIAVGPVQGRERAIDGPGKETANPTRKRKELWRHVETFRRHRLMLTYYDHTVLSYEIGRMGTSLDHHHIPGLSVR